MILYENVRLARLADTVLAEAVRCAHARTVCFMAERTVLPHISKKREYMVVSSAGRDSMYASSGLDTCGLLAQVPMACRKTRRRHGSHSRITR